jgi:hypothetical protein
MNSEETQQGAIPSITVQPASGFIGFDDNDIEQSIPERFGKMVRTGGHRVAIGSGPELYSFDSVNRTANRLARQILARRGSA